MKLEDIQQFITFSEAGGGLFEMIFIFFYLLLVCSMSSLTVHVII